MTQIDINPDQTISVKWTGRKGRGSLFHTMAEGNAKNVNRLNHRQLLAILLCVKFVPFPLGRELQVYQRMLDHMDEQFADTVAKVEAMPLGQLRKEIVVSAGSGCNAPHDTYIDAAIKVLFPQEQSA